jgi:hypothetical protein
MSELPVRPGPEALAVIQSGRAQPLRASFHTQESSWLMPALSIEQGS